MFYQMKKKQFCFINDVLEINYQSCCILSGPPCISWDSCRNAAVWAFWKKAAIGHMPIFNAVILIFSISVFNHFVEIVEFWP